MKRLTTHLFIASALLFAVSISTLAQTPKIKQVTFQLKSGGYVVVDIVLPDGIEKLDVTLEEFDADGKLTTESVDLPTASTAATPTRTPRPTRTPTPADRQTATVNRYSNLRGGPGTNYDVAASAKSGDTVEIVDTNADGTWYKLSNGYWIAAFLVTSHDSNAPVPTATRTPTNAPTPTPTTSTDDIEAQVRAQLVRGRAGTKDIKAYNPLDGLGGFNVHVTFEISSGWSDSSTKRGITFDIKDTLEKIQSANLDGLREVVIFGDADQIDTLGNSSNARVLKVVYDAETISQINFSQFLPDNVYIIANEVWRHAAIQ